MRKIYITRVYFVLKYEKIKRMQIKRKVKNKAFAWFYKIKKLTVAIEYKNNYIIKIHTKFIFAPSLIKLICSPTIYL